MAPPGNVERCEGLWQLVGIVATADFTPGLYLERRTFSLVEPGSGGGGNRH